MLNPIPSASGLFDRAYSNKVLSYNPIAYWPLWEPSGNTAHCLVNSSQDGSYTSVTLNQTGIGDGCTSGLFDGVNSYVNIYSAALNAAFDGSLGSLLIWARVANAGAWTDGTVRILAQLRVNGNNRILLYKSNANNTLNWLYRANGTSQSVSKAAVSTIGWMCLGLTWDESNDEVKAYYGGAQEGATQNGLDTWSGALNNTVTLFGGSSTTPADVWSGYAARGMLCNAALGTDAMQNLGAI